MLNLRKNYDIYTILVLFFAFSLSTQLVLAQAATEADDTPSTTTTAASASPATTSSDVTRAAVAFAPRAEKAKEEFKPYLAEITASSVYVRSGPAEIYYPVGKLTRSQQVIVVEEKHGLADWAKIEPTPECFSYISKKYVEPMTTAGAPGASAVKKGVVTGDNIRVRAGSIKVPPAYANQVQTKLSQGDLVEIIGERDDYYKIVTPKGCHFWTSLKYVKPVGVATDDAVEVVRSQASKAVIAGPKADIPVVQYQKERQEFMAIAAMFEAEQKKPLKQREFEAICARVDALNKSGKSPSVKSGLNSLVANLSRAIMAQEALLRSIQQDERLKMTLAQIDQTVELMVAESNLASKKDEKKIVIQGRIAPSAIFTAPNKNRRFLVLDDDDMIRYYAVSDIEGLDLSKWIGKKVSLNGVVKYDSFGKTRILYIDSIVEVKEKATLVEPSIKAVPTATTVPAAPEEEPKTE